MRGRSITDFPQPPGCLSRLVALPAHGWLSALDGARPQGRHHFVGRGLGHLVETSIQVAEAGRIDLVVAAGGGSAIGLGKAIGYHALERDGQALAQRREGLLVSEGCMPRLLNPGVATRATAHGQERIALGCHGRSKSSLRSGPVELGELLAHDHHPRGRSRIAGVDAKERRQRLELLGGAAVLDRPADVNA